MPKYKDPPQQRVSATFFGETKEVVASIYNTHVQGPISEFLWVEGPGDYYALLSLQLKNKKVAVVTRESWMAADL